MLLQRDQVILSPGEMLHQTLYWGHNRLIGLEHKKRSKRDNDQNLRWSLSTHMILFIVITT